MNKITSLIIVAFGMMLTSCNSNSNKNNSVADTVAQNKADTVAANQQVHYEINYLDNKKDPTCGMPVTAGVSDTAHYETKVIGFCSTECKNEFLKNPKAGLAAAELKK